MTKVGVGAISADFFDAGVRSVAAVLTGRRTVVPVLLGGGVRLPLVSHGETAPPGPAGEDGCGS
jgi:hypothetical protein